MLFLFRSVLLCTSFLAIIPLFGPHVGAQCYFWSMRIALMAYSIRLTQRKRQAGVSLFSRDFLALFCSEDSGHYVWYSLLYLSCHPSAFFLMPLLLYAVFQVPQYAAGLTQVANLSVGNLVGRLHTWVHGKQTGILRFIATSEIFLMVIVVFNIFSGVGVLYAPVGHYYFLKWRYQSRRNPYVRIMFSELRVAAEVLMRHPSCPQFVKNALNRAIAFLSSLAPPPTTPQ